MEVEEVRDITGIALGNSSVESPGFPGATLQGIFQEFAQKKLSHEGNGGNNKMDLKEITR